MEVELREGVDKLVAGDDSEVKARDGGGKVGAVVGGEVGDDTDDVFKLTARNLN
ncbi:hypothetical protein AGMMS50222_10570 [Endomicrobiia bacterium]|nr:hypothetical protein AGMMS49556_08430 [Endomicrobiia bacterium]GHT77184.1 hypothetical protein AGMMS50222_10570 [Endomicrobiia bacterium]